ncbi:MAG: toprim domain-containing protein, partial [Ruminiclostridium sp.]|nr:toprim domain-containing protein [Ruminiclostridium sp.]
MIKVKQAVIVEGKYDKIKLSSVIDGLIITTDGFSVFKNKEKINLIRKLAENQGIIILTDSDSAGFKIRNYIKGCTQKGNITNIYIPDIFGKEKRKTTPSKEGKLGVEGIPIDVLKDAFEKADINSENT